MGRARAPGDWGAGGAEAPQGGRGEVADVTVRSIYVLCCGDFNFKETSSGYILHRTILAMKWPLRIVLDVTSRVLLRLGFTLHIDKAVRGWCVN